MKSNTNATKSQNWLPISLIIFSILLTALPWAMPLIWPNIIVHLYYMVPGLVLLSAVSIQTINQNFKQAIQEAKDLKIDATHKNTEQRGNDNSTIDRMNIDTATTSTSTNLTKNDNASSSSVISIDTSTTSTSTNLTKDDRVALYITDTNIEYTAESTKNEMFDDAVNNQLRLSTGRPVQLDKFFKFNMKPDSWAQYFQKTLMEIRNASSVGQYYKVKDNNLTLNKIIRLFIDAIDYSKHKHNDNLVPKTFLDQALNLYKDQASQIQKNISKNMKEIQNKLNNITETSTQSPTYDDYVSALEEQKKYLSDISAIFTEVSDKIDAYFNHRDLSSLPLIKKLPEISLFTAIPEGKNEQYFDFLNARYESSIAKLKHKYNNELLDQIISELHIDDATGQAVTSLLKTCLSNNKLLIDEILKLKQKISDQDNDNCGDILLQKKVFELIDADASFSEEDKEEDAADEIINKLTAPIFTVKDDIRQKISDLVLDISENKKRKPDYYTDTKNLCFKIIDLTLSVFSIDEDTMLSYTLDENADKYFEAIDEFIRAYKNNKTILDESKETTDDKSKRSFLVISKKYESNLPTHTKHYMTDKNLKSPLYDYRLEDIMMDMIKKVRISYEEPSDYKPGTTGFNY
ncbi:MAG: hypothetical protein ACON5A_04425 [Candidatus Comchoanobacterales bacterium]